MKILKIIGGFFLLLLLCLIIIPFLIPKTFYIKKGTDFLENRFPISLDIKDASLSLLPQAHVTFRGVAIQPKMQATRLPSLTTETLELSIPWHALLNKEPDLKITLQKAKIKFVGNPQDLYLETFTFDHLDHSDNNYSFHSSSKGKWSDITFEYSGKTRLMIVPGANQGNLSLDLSPLNISKPEILSLKEKQAHFEATFNHSELQTEISKGILKLGPQIFSLDGLSESNGTLKGNLASPELDMAYLKKMLPSLEALPEMDKVSFEARYQEGIVSGTIKAAKIKLPDEDLNQVSSAFTFVNSALSINDLKAGFMDGTLSGNTKVSFATHQPETSFDLNLVNIATERLSSLGKMVRGRGNFALKGSQRGFSKDDLVKTLSGEGNLSFPKMQIVGLNMFEKVFSIPAWNPAEKIPGLLVPGALKKMKDLDSTLHDLEGSFQIANGRIIIPKLEVSLPNIHANFVGKLGLDKKLDVDGTILFEKVFLDNLIQAQALKDFLLAGADTLSIPLHISGSTDHPSVSLEDGFIAGKLKSFLHSQGDQKVEDVVQDVLKNKDKKDAVDKIKDEIKDFLKKIP